MTEAEEMTHMHDTLVHFDTLEPSQVPISRQRMMRKTYVASQQRDLLQDHLQRLCAMIESRWVDEAVSTQAAIARGALAESRQLGRVFANARTAVLRAA